MLTASFTIGFTDSTGLLAFLGGCCCGSVTVCHVAVCEAYAAAAHLECSAAVLYVPAVAAVLAAALAPVVAFARGCAAVSVPPAAAMLGEAIAGVAAAALALAVASAACGMHRRGRTETPECSGVCPCSAKGTCTRPPSPQHCSFALCPAAVCAD